MQRRQALQSCIYRLEGLDTEAFAVAETYMVTGKKLPGATALRPQVAASESQPANRTRPIEGEAGAADSSPAAPLFFMQPPEPAFAGQPHRVIHVAVHDRTV